MGNLYASVYHGRCRAVASCFAGAFLCPLLGWPVIGKQKKSVLLLGNDSGLRSLRRREEAAKMIFFGGPNETSILLTMEARRHGGMQGRD